MEIIPAILTDDIREARELIVKVKESGKFGRIQVDFVDGEYENNRTFLPGDVLVSEFSELKFDAHLMVTQRNIDRWFNEAEVAGYDRIIPQMESLSEQGNFRSLAMDLDSPLAAIEPYLGNLEVVVVMSVEPGFGGQEFINKAIKLLRDLDQAREKHNYNFRICVDGGIENIHVSFLEEWGADEVAVGAARALQWDIQ